MQSPEDLLVSRYMAEQSAAREIMNAGRDLLAENQYAEAEERFRELLRRFPNDRYAAQTNYYLIRALVEARQAEEALLEVERFQQRFPNSTWLNDVLEERIRLTNELPRLAAFRAPAAPAPPRFLLPPRLHPPPRRRRHL